MPCEGCPITLERLTWLKLRQAACAPRCAPPLFDSGRIARGSDAASIGAHNAATSRDVEQANVTKAQQANAGRDLVMTCDLI